MISLKPLTLSVLLAWAAMTTQAAHARDTMYKLSFADLMASAEAKAKLDPAIKIYLAGQTTPKVLSRHGDEITNRKTNGVGKADEDGCRWAALSGLLALQEKARAVGANAVIDVVSYYKRQTFESAAEYECHAGAIVIGVAFKGTIAKVEP